MDNNTLYTVNVIQLVDTELMDIKSKRTRLAALNFYDKDTQIGISVDGAPFEYATTYKLGNYYSATFEHVSAKESANCYEVIRAGLDTENNIWSFTLRSTMEVNKETCFVHINAALPNFNCNIGDWIRVRIAELKEDI